MSTPNSPFTPSRSPQCVCMLTQVLFFHCVGPSDRIQVARLMQQALLLTKPYLLSYFLLVIIPLSVLAFSLSSNE